MRKTDWFVAAIEATPTIAQSSTNKMRFCRSRRFRRAWISASKLAFMEPILPEIRLAIRLYCQMPRDCALLAFIQRLLQVA
jgi:hypothetical protein